VVAVSTDFIETLRHWSKELNATYPLASDKLGKVAQEYGVYIPTVGVANRVTFVLDVDGKIVHIDEGREALDPSGAINACSRIKKK
jgi:thioredoxin-dependent peroxiredoxin